MHKGWLLAMLGCLGCGPEVSVPEALEQTSPSAPVECHVFTGSGSAAPERLPTEKQPSRCDDPASQGELVASVGPTSLAIVGSGFFVLSTPRGLRFTRWGEFSIDADSFSTSRDGYRLQGLKAEKELKPLQLRNTQMLAQATTTVTLKSKLDPNAHIQSFDPLSPASTANFNASVTIFDSLGESHDVTVYFNRTATGMWDWRALVPDGSALTGGTGLEGIVQNIGGNRNELTFTTQDGHSAGSLERLLVDVGGRVSVLFSNGSTQEVGRVALANFAWARGLRRDADGTFAETKESGAAIIGAPLAVTFGEVRSQMLEQPCQP